jgi:MFS family permease
MRNYAQLLRNNPNFALLWYAQAVSLIGDWFNTIVLSGLVSAYSGGSGLAISLLLLARFLPPLIVSPLAGVLLDRFNRKRLLIASDLARTVIVLGFLLASSADKLWLIYLFTILQFGFSAIFEPGRSALMPNVLRREDLVLANILSSVTWSVMLAVGGALGGLVSLTFGIAAALLFDAATFLASALLISRIRVRANAADHGAAVTERISMREVFGGLRYARQHPPTAATLLVKLGGSVGSMDTILIIYATVLFVIGEGGSGSLGILWSAFGIGAVLGPLIINRFNDGTVRVLRRLIIVGYGLITVGWLLLSGAALLPVAALAVVIKAMGSSIYWTNSSVILQGTVPNQYLGRVFSLDQAGFQFATVVSTLATGLLVESLGVGSVRQIVFWTGIASLIPLTLWTRAIPWIEQRSTREAVVEG